MRHPSSIQSPSFSPTPPACTQLDHSITSPLPPAPPLRRQELIFPRHRPALSYFSCPLHWRSRDPARQQSNPPASCSPANANGGPPPSADGALLANSREIEGLLSGRRCSHALGKLHPHPLLSTGTLLSLTSLTNCLLPPQGKPTEEIKPTASCSCCTPKDREERASDLVGPTVFVAMEHGLQRRPSPPLRCYFRRQPLHPARERAPPVPYSHGKGWGTDRGSARPKSSPSQPPREVPQQLRSGPGRRRKALRQADVNCGGVAGQLRHLLLVWKTVAVGDNDDVERDGSSSL